MRAVYKIAFLFLLSSAIIFSISCVEKESSVSPVTKYAYKIPRHSEDGLMTASLSDVGMKEDPILEFMTELLNQDDHQIHGILIVKDGKLVFSAVFV